MKLRNLALITMSPFLYPKNIVQWVRAVGKKFGLDSADLNFHYICYSLSITVTKITNDRGSNIGGIGEEADVWLPIGSELISCIRRMKTIHIKALCYIISGATMSAEYEGYGMLYSIGEGGLAYEEIIILLSTIYTALKEKLVDVNNISNYLIPLKEIEGLVPFLFNLIKFIENVKDSNILNNVTYKDILFKNCMNNGEGDSGLTDVYVFLLCSFPKGENFIRNFIKSCNKINENNNEENKNQSENEMTSIGESLNIFVNAAFDRCVYKLTNIELISEKVDILMSLKYLINNIYLNFDVIESVHFVRAMISKAVMISFVTNCIAENEGIDLNALKSCLNVVQLCMASLLDLEGSGAEEERVRGNGHICVHVRVILLS